MRQFGWIRIYRNNVALTFIALGFSGRILEEAFFEMQTSPSFDIESISDKCEASMTKEWKDYKEWEKAHSMMEG